MYGIFKNKKDVVYLSIIVVLLLVIITGYLYISSTSRKTQELYNKLREGQAKTRLALTTATKRISDSEKTITKLKGTITEKERIVTNLERNFRETKRANTELRDTIKKIKESDREQQEINRNIGDSINRCENAVNSSLDISENTRRRLEEIKSILYNGSN